MHPHPIVLFLHKLSSFLRCSLEIIIIFFLHPSSRLSIYFFILSSLNRHLSYSKILHFSSCKTLYYCQYAMFHFLIVCHCLLFLFYYCCCFALNPPFSLHLKPSIIPNLKFCYVVFLNLWCCCL